MVISCCAMGGLMLFLPYYKLCFLAQRRFAVTVAEHHRPCNKIFERSPSDTLRKTRKTLRTEIVMILVPVFKWCTNGRKTAYLSAFCRTDRACFRGRFASRCAPFLSCGGEEDSFLYWKKRKICVGQEKRPLSRLIAVFFYNPSSNTVSCSPGRLGA